jgi:asparagine synthase (glutamine-hydrolysing)
MMSALAHRGPDGEGVWIEPERSVYLGHKRLSIIDLATGHQPMATIDGKLIIVFNGEIYNHRELRQELEAKGHRFATNHSDTEVLLHGYREWGTGLPNRLNGMWAFVIYNSTNGTLYASRDRFGKKPFFYTTLNGGFVFASELDSIRGHLAVRGKLSLSRLALKKYFGYGYIPAPHTIWESIKKLPGGHSLWMDEHNPAHIRIERYWSFQLEPEPIRSEKEADARAEELRAAIDSAVARRLVADVPVGVFLSGGVDSSAIAALAAKHLGPGRLNTFSIGFEEPSFDESKYARIVANHCGTKHHEECLSIEHARTLLPELAAKIDEPLGDSSLLPTSLLCRFARKHVKVALGGDGGDELFAGYDPFKALKAAQIYSALTPKPIHRAIAATVARLPVSHRNMSFDFKLKRFLRAVDYPQPLWVPTWMAPLTAKELNELFEEPVAPEELYSEAISAWDECSQHNAIDRTTQFYINLYLQDDILTKIDRASMMVGLEARSPLLDCSVADVARKIPAEWRYRNGETKYLFKRAFRALLPKTILDRRKKGFGMPIGAWFQEERLTISAPALGTVFTETVQREHVSGKHDQRAFLWSAWLLSLWKRAKTDAHPAH